MATLKKSKLEALINHISKGGDSDPETYAGILGIDVEDTETISAYIRRAKASLPEAEDTEEKSRPPVYQLKDNDGIIRDLELVRQKGHRTILALPVVRDLVTVVIRGDKVEVDLEELKGLDKDSRFNGVPVSTLIAAAELAKG